jgi:AbrB family looped-hinge helix DNA binding protein
MSKIYLTEGDIMEIAITKMSSKGQVVIPSEMRKGLREGEKLLMMQSKDQWILKKASSLEKDLADDLAFAKKTQAAWKRIEFGKSMKMDFDDFLEELKKW